MIAAVIAGWVMVPWKILGSAATFLNFMGGYAVFLAPIAGILASDYWLVKKQHIDVPALYDPHGRYHYQYGTNWRAMVAFLFAVVPLLPGLAQSIESTPLPGKNLGIGAGLKNLYTFDWLYGFVVSIFLYTTLSKFFPATESLVEHTIYHVEETYEGQEPVFQNDRKDFGNVDAVDMGLGHGHEHGSGEESEKTSEIVR